MSLQTKVLNDYKYVFPKDTLKDISQKTGIQITRVFRLFNGSEMRLNEFESFEKVITKHTYSPKHASFIDTSEKCLKALTQEKIKSLFALMNYQLKSQNLKDRITPQKSLSIA